MSGENAPDIAGSLLEVNKEMTRAYFLSLLLCSTAFAAVQHHHDQMPAAGDGEFNPYIVADNRGGFYLAYIENSNGGANVMLKHSDDGQRFSAAVRVNDLAGDAAVRNENPPKVAVSTKGIVYACWANERERWKGNIRFARSTDGGHTFSHAININSDAGGKPCGHAFQSLTVDGKGRIYLAWIDERNKAASDRGAEIWMSTSDDDGKSFSKDRRILSDVCECCRTNIQIDSAGRLFLAYRHVPSIGPMYRDVYVASSSDQGRTFQYEKVSSDGWEINGCPVNGPALAVGFSGQITVVWFTGGGSQPGLYYATSADHGKTFSPRKLLDPRQNLGRHAQAVPLPNGNIFVAWDEKVDKLSVVTGVLDIGAGSVREKSVQTGASYPSIAVNGKVGVQAGMTDGSSKIELTMNVLSGAKNE